MSVDKIASLSRAAEMLVGSPTVTGKDLAVGLGWIDSSGNITDSGEDAFQAFQEQSSTRSAFRTIAV